MAWGWVGVVVVVIALAFLSKSFQKDRGEEVIRRMKERGPLVFELDDNTKYIIDLGQELKDHVISNPHSFFFLCKNLLKPSLPVLP